MIDILHDECYTTLEIALVDANIRENDDYNLIRYEAKIRAVYNELSDYLIPNNGLNIDSIDEINILKSINKLNTLGLYTVHQSHIFLDRFYLNYPFLPKLKKSNFMEDQGLNSLFFIPQRVKTKDLTLGLLTHNNLQQSFENLPNIYKGKITKQSEKIVTMFIVYDLYTYHNYSYREISTELEKQKYILSKSTVETYYKSISQLINSYK